MPDLSPDQIAALVQTGALNNEIVAALGRDMTDSEKDLVNRSRLAWRMSRVKKRVERSKRKEEAQQTQPEEKALKIDRLRSQVALLNAKIAQIEKTSVPIEEVSMFLSEVSGIVKHAFGNWVDRVSARGNKQDAQEARRLSDRTLTRLADKLEELDNLTTLSDGEEEAADGE